MSSSRKEYARPVGGKLTFKGSEGIKKKSKKKKKRKHCSKDGNDGEDVEGAAPEFKLVKARGTGRIVTSGTTVMGREDTKFLLELSAGDAIIIRHPTTLQEETRIVTMVLSDMSISLSSPFSSDLISSTTFEFIKAPPEATAASSKTSKAEASELKKKEQEKAAFGTYAGGTTSGTQVTYRVRKKTAYGGYSIVKETASDNTTREDLLDRRTKMKGDRHCN